MDLTHAPMKTKSDALMGPILCECDQFAAYRNLAQKVNSYTQPMCFFSFLSY